jgi:hypothetical protein
MHQAGYSGPKRERRLGEGLSSCRTDRNVGAQTHLKIERPGRVCTREDLLNASADRLNDLVLVDKVDLPRGEASQHRARGVIEKKRDRPPAL